MPDLRAEANVSRTPPSISFDLPKTCHIMRIGSGSSSLSATRREAASCVTHQAGRILAPNPAAISSMIALVDSTRTISFGQTPAGLK
jgi:hypothetical protein